jgi:hypothetical protein
MNHAASQMLGDGAKLSISLAVSHRRFSKGQLGVANLNAGGGTLMHECDIDQTTMAKSTHQTTNLGQITTTTISALPWPRLDPPHQG